MADIFVSYASGDRERVRPLVEAIEASGFSVWWDTRIGIGSSFDREIEAQLRNASCVVTIWSAASVDSNWVREETQDGLDRGILVPVQIELCELPLGFRRTQTAQLLGWPETKHDLSSLLSSISSHIEIEPGNTEQTQVIASSYRQPEDNSLGKRAASSGRRRFALTLVGIAFAAVIGWYLKDSIDGGRQAEHERALEAAEQLLVDDRYGEAFGVLGGLHDRLAGSPRFDSLWAQTVMPMSPRISEAGATVYFRPYSGLPDSWFLAGVSPLTDVPAPFGVLVLKIEKPGFDTARYVVANPGAMLANETFRYFDGEVPEMVLQPSETIAKGMVYIPESNIPVVLQGTPVDEPPFGRKRYRMPAFALSRAEVTNREFKAFVDNGGYVDDVFWEGLILPDGSAFDGELIGNFVDSTGRHGPSTWELGSFPTQTGDMPVGGISWYESVAYARFAGMALPSVHHWSLAAQGPLEGQYATAFEIVRRSNYGSDGPRVAEPATVGPWGTFDMAGNMREWVWNAGGNGHFSMGGSWSDYAGNYLVAYAVDPADRSPQNGLRLMQSLSDDPITPSLLGPIRLLSSLPSAMRAPISNEGFKVIRGQFLHVRKTPGTIVSRLLDEGEMAPPVGEDYVFEEVVINYNDQDVSTLIIGRPKNIPHPLQSVIYLPTSGSFSPSPNGHAPFHLSQLEFIMRSGRAIILPIWKNSFERFEPPSTDANERTNIDRERALAWYEDVSRTIDFLEDNENYDANRVALFGFSFGGSYSPIVLATEQRLKAAIVVSAGILPNSEQAMWDPVNYLPHVRLPLLYVTGEFDPIFPKATSQARFLELLGTSGDDVRHVLFNELGHFDFPRNRFYREVGDWLDKFLGPVR